MGPAQKRTPQGMEGITKKLDKMKLSDYKKVDKYRFIDLLEHKKGKSPKYAAYFTWFLDGEKDWITDENSLTDLKIKIDEYELAAFGPGILTGYAFRGEKPEEVYRTIRIGRYVLRDRATHLPKFAAAFFVEGNAENPYGPERVEGQTIADVKKGIRETLSKFKLTK